MNKGRPEKEFQEYIVDANGRHIVHEDYLRSPATAFLRYTVEAKDAANYCQNYFGKNNDGTYRKDAQDSLQHILSAFLPAIMGHFETYQRHLFAGVFEYSSLLHRFDVEGFLKKLEKDYSVKISPLRLAAYRGFNAPVGVLLADTLPGWHHPERVNSYFKAFGFKKEFFSSDDCKRLRILWQLRHSIVHTGGSITIPDAQKISELEPYGDKPVVFDNQFVFEVSRKMHPLVQKATNRIESSFLDTLQDNIVSEDRQALEELFEVKSSVAVWLR